MSEVTEPEQFRKLFVGSLNYKTTEETLKSHFEQWGEIEDCVVMRDPHTKNSRGFAFLTYKRAHMVDDAQASRPHKIDDREIETKRAVPKEDSGKPEAQIKVNKLFVSGIKDDLGEEDLREYFGPYGNIVKINVVTDKNTGKKKGFAFVEFDDYDPVDKIVLQQHNYKGKKLEVKKGFSRKEIDSIKAKKEMRGFGRGRGGAAKEPTSDAFNGYSYGGVYSSGYGYGSAGGWNSDYGDNYSNGSGAVWGAASYGSSYGGGPVRGNADYAQRSQGPYGGARGGRGSGGYGRR